MLIVQDVTKQYLVYEPDGPSVRAEVVNGKLKSVAVGRTGCTVEFSATSFYKLFPLLESVTEYLKKEGVFNA